MLSTVKTRSTWNTMLFLSSVDEHRCWHDTCNPSNACVVWPKTYAHTQVLIVVDQLTPDSRVRECLYPVLHYCIMYMALVISVIIYSSVFLAVSLLVTHQRSVYTNCCRRTLGSFKSQWVHIAGAWTRSSWWTVWQSLLWLWVCTRWKALRVVLWLQRSPSVSLLMLLLLYLLPLILPFL